ncbi:MAG: BlaI/MecI/CopY family transcriptional regulator [Planctomycetota bacterium]
MVDSSRPPLGPLETQVMRIVWDIGKVTADEVRLRLQSTDDLKDSTVRTILRRLESKGYVRHEVNGRVFVYEPAVEPQEVAPEHVQGIVERLCGGSVEELLVGMVGDSMISPAKLRELADRISAAEKQSGAHDQGKKGKRGGRKSNG